MQAKSENGSLYDDVYKLIDAFGSKDLLCEDDSLPSVTESNDYGDKEIYYTAIYEVASGEEKYVFYIKECVENTSNPDCVGVYTIAVFRAEDYEKSDFHNINLDFAGAKFFDVL